MIEGLFEMDARKAIKINHFMVILILLRTGLAVATRETASWT